MKDDLQFPFVSYLIVRVIFRDPHNLEGICDSTISEFDFHPLKQEAEKLNNHFYLGSNSSSWSLLDKRGVSNFVEFSSSMGVKTSSSRSSFGRAD